MTPKDRLKEIKDNWPQRKQFPNAIFNIDAGDLDWLISRIEQLEKALEEIAKFSGSVMYDSQDKADEALETMP